MNNYKHYGGSGRCGINNNNNTHMTTCVSLDGKVANHNNIVTDSDLCERVGKRCRKVKKGQSMIPMVNSTYDKNFTKCDKVPSLGGYSINELRTKAKQLGINTAGINKKEICYLIGIKINHPTILFNKSCKRLTSKRVSGRKLPPYSATECSGQEMEGTDGQLYISVPNKNGRYRWKLKSKLKRQVSKNKKEEWLYMINANNFNQQFAIEISDLFIKAFDRYPTATEIIKEWDTDIGKTIRVHFKIASLLNRGE
jgi:hypothetical protein